MLQHEATRQVLIANGVLRPALNGPTPQGWVDRPTLRLLPGERAKNEAEARRRLLGGALP